MATKPATTRKPSTTVTTTVKPISDKVAQRNLDAVVAAFTESDNVHVRRTRAIGALAASGLSVRGIVAQVTVHTGGAVPSGFSKSSVSRYVAVAAALARPELIAVLGNVDTATRAAVTGDLYRIAGPGGGNADVARAAEMAWKADGPDAAILAIATVKGDVSRIAAGEATKAPAREVGGTARMRGLLAPNVTAPEVDPDATGEPIEPTDAGKSAANVRKGITDRTGDTLSALSLLTLITEATRRVNARGFTPDAAILDAIENLAQTVESFVNYADEEVNA